MSSLQTQNFENHITTNVEVMTVEGFLGVAQLVRPLMISVGGYAGKGAYTDRDVRHRVAELVNFIRARWIVGTPIYFITDGDKLKPGAFTYVVQEAAKWLRNHLVGDVKIVAFVSDAMPHDPTDPDELGFDIPSVMYVSISPDRILRARNLILSNDACKAVLYGLYGAEEINEAERSVKFETRAGYVFLAVCVQMLLHLTHLSVARKQIMVDEETHIKCLREFVSGTTPYCKGAVSFFEAFLQGLQLPDDIIEELFPNGEQPARPNIPELVQKFANGEQ